jgi:hypothetical protein
MREKDRGDSLGSDWGPPSVQEVRDQRKQRAAAMVELQLMSGWKEFSTHWEEQRTIKLKQALSLGNSLEERNQASIEYNVISRMLSYPDVLINEQGINDGR